MHEEKVGQSWPNLFFLKNRGLSLSQLFLKNISNFKVLASTSDSASSDNHFAPIFGTFLKNLTEIWSVKVGRNLRKKLFFYFFRLGHFFGLFWLFWAKNGTFFLSSTNKIVEL